ncbi:MAG: SH3 domain-containing protein [Planctomycetota bacterium]
MLLGARIGLAICLAAGSSLGLAQTSETGAASSQPGHYWLRITADDVNLRSQPDNNSIIITGLGRDDVLEAVSEQFGWHRVCLPDGVFSYVGASYIDRTSEQEGIVSVRTGNLRVRVGSLIRELDPLQSEVQVLLPRGTPVQIVGQQGDWLKIEPPEGAYGYVSGELVEKISAAGATALRLAATSRPVAVAGATSQPAASSPDLTGTWGQRMRLVEAAIAAEGQRPPLEQSWDKLVIRLRSIAAQREEPAVARLATSWIEHLEQRVVAQEALRAAEELAERQNRSRAQYEREMHKIRQAESQASKRTAFVVQGQLLRSPDPGANARQERYILRDPITRQVVAYVIFPAGGALKPEQFLRKYVGVRGDRVVDSALGADVIRVDEIVSLELTTPDSQPPRGKP